MKGDIFEPLSEECKIGGQDSLLKKRWIQNTSDCSSYMFLGISWKLISSGRNYIIVSIILKFNQSILPGCYYTCMLVITKLNGVYF
jgi:hypothetical protein